MIVSNMPSSVIAHMDYDAEKEILRVIYVSGSIYEYLGVTLHEFKELRASQSKGRYLNFFIKPNHEYRKVI